MDNKSLEHIESAAEQAKFEIPQEAKEHMQEVDDAQLLKDAQEKLGEYGKTVGHHVDVKNLEGESVILPDQQEQYYAKNASKDFRDMAKTRDEFLKMKAQKGLKDQKAGILDRIKNKLFGENNRKGEAQNAA